MMHRPVCDLHRFPRLARHDDDSVLFGVRRHPTVMSGDKGAASHLVQPFPHYSLAACKSMLASLHLAEAQRANLATWFETRDSVAIEDVYVTMVRLATRFGEPLMRTHQATCPLEDLFDVEGRSYIDTANAVATTIACRRLDLFCETCTTSPATKQLLSRMLKTTPHRPLHLTVTEIQQLNAVCIAFLLHPHWFPEWCRPSVYYAALASGVGGQKKRKTRGVDSEAGSGAGAPRAFIRVGSGAPDDDASSEGGATAASNGSSSMQPPAQKPRLNGQADTNAPKRIIYAHNTLMGLTPFLQSHIYGMLEDYDAARCMRALQYRAYFTQWDRRIIRKRQNWFHWVHARRRGRPIDIVIQAYNKYGIWNPCPNPLVIPNYVQRCEINEDLTRPVTFASDAKLETLYIDATSIPDLVIPRSVCKLVLGPGFNSPLTFAPLEGESHLSEFAMSNLFNQPVCLPASVKTVIMGDACAYANLRFEGPVALDRFVMSRTYNEPGFRVPVPVRELVLGDRYNQADFVVPRSTEILYLGEDFNQPLQFEWEAVPLSHSVESLDDSDDVADKSKAIEDDPFASFYTANVTSSKRFGRSFHSQAYNNNPGLFRQAFPVSSSGHAPSTRMATVLRHLRTGKAFNRPVQLPSTLERLEFHFDGRFNSTFTFVSTPHRLTTLHFGNDFNQPCPHLPGSLTDLEFGSDFNQEFAFETPPTLDRLVFGRHFSRPWLHIPPNTRVVKMHYGYNQPDFYIPRGVQRCNIPDFQTYPITFQLPSSLQMLALPDKYNAPGLVVPRSVLSLFLGIFFNQPIAFEAESQLHEFYMSGKFDQDICLPASVREVMENDEFRHRVTFSGPVALDRYKMGNSFNAPGFSIPGTVRQFEMGDTYNQPDFRIPDGTEEFTMGAAFNQPLFVPASVLIFKMGDGFNSSLAFAADCRVGHLQVGDAFYPPKGTFVVPASVKTFYKGFNGIHVTYAPRAHKLDVIN
jgi:hypothetical protein